MPEREQEQPQQQETEAEVIEISEEQFYEGMDEMRLYLVEQMGLLQEKFESDCKELQKQVEMINKIAYRARRSALLGKRVRYYQSEQGLSFAVESKEPMGFHLETNKVNE